MNMIYRNSIRIITLLIFLLLSCDLAQCSDYSIGVYYFPGWRSGLSGAPSLQPWNSIKPYPEREPLLGWYDDGSVEIMNKQLEWMHEYGINYVVFDWFWTGNTVFLDQSLKAYMEASNRTQTPFSLLWANHDGAPRSHNEFLWMVQFWIANYFKMPEFYRIDGHPVIFIFSHELLEKKAAEFGMTAKELINEAQAMMHASKLPDIYFVSNTIGTGLPSDHGYAAMSTYNYHGLQRPSESYVELDKDYRKIWAYQSARNTVRYIVPMTSGWDKRPWGGSKPPKHDFSFGTPDEFENHLRASKAFIDANQVATGRTGIICCWNEFGEGSYIEPTKKDGFSYLEKVKKVFGTK